MGFVCLDSLSMHHQLFMPYAASTTYAQIGAYALKEWVNDQPWRLPGPSTATTRIATGETSPHWGPTHQHSDPTRQRSSPTHQPSPQLADNPPQVGSLNANPGDVRIWFDNLVAWALPGSDLVVYLIVLACSQNWGSNFDHELPVGYRNQKTEMAKIK